MSMSNYDHNKKITVPGPLFTLDRTLNKRLSALFFIGAMTLACTPSVQAQRDGAPEPHPEGEQHPTSQPSLRETDSPSSPKDEHREEASSETAWGEATFNQGINPHILHRPDENRGVALFAGGCFWCMEAPFEKLKGVTAVYSGYTGGQEPRPSYSQVSSYKTQHIEAVIVYYRPQEISYNELLHTYWRSINPTQMDGQFADRGHQYTTGIFTVDKTQQRAARVSKESLTTSKTFRDAIAVKLYPAEMFWPAEDYHQDYYKLHKSHYLRYKYGSGRAAYLKETWGVE